MSDARRQGGASYMAALSLSALGVVYGDIGTSPLYSMKEALAAVHGHALEGDHLPPADPADVYGIVSLIFWSLLMIVTVKYLVFVLRADNRGEGGILSLTALVREKMPKHRRVLHILMFVGLFGTALLYGDGMLTPAVSVLSAVEGLELAVPSSQPYIVPITVLILMGLFSVQRFGTERVGRAFGPVMLVWFLTLFSLGLVHVLQAPEILTAVMPQYGIEYLWHMGWKGFAVLGSVFLVVTGGEALYADLGHFGARPIRWAWFTVVFPALIVNYFGQGAMLLRHPEQVGNPFYGLAPTSLLIPFVVLSTAATVIASQALITGTYSLTMQAIQQRYLPRLQVDHTSEHEVGQIYVPTINWALMIACVLLVVTFKSSTHLAAAYGVAVTLTMLITSFLLYFMLRYGFGWNRWAAFGLCGFFMGVETVFFAGNALKIPHGGWIPLVIGAVMFVVMSTWQRGRQRLAHLRSESGVPLANLVGRLPSDKAVRVPGTAVFMHQNPDIIPPALLLNIEHNHVLHAKNIICTVKFEDQPFVARHEVARVATISDEFYVVHMRFGYMDRPDVPAVLHDLEFGGEPFDSEKASYFLARETILPRHWLYSGMATWRERLFAFMSKNAQDATAFFNIPPSHVMEVGSQVEI